VLGRLRNEVPDYQMILPTALRQSGARKLRNELARAGDLG